MSAIKTNKRKNRLDQLLETLDTLSVKPTVRKATYISTFLFFIAIILIPPLIGVILKWNLIGDTLQNPALVNRAYSAILASFIIAFFVSLLDLVAALPTAWYIVRKKSRWTNIIDTLADIPFVIPTVALGFSVLTFWNSPQGLSGLLNMSSLISPGVGLIMLLHFAFSYPIIVRIIVGELQEYDQVYEIAARTLGASPLTAIRTITLPIMKPAIISAFLLAFCRSLSETGATAVVAGVFENGPVFIRNARVAGQEGPMVFVSLVLILTSCTIFALISLLGPKLRFPSKKVWPKFERFLSKSRPAAIKDRISIIIFGFFVVLPSLFAAYPGIFAFLDGTAASALTGKGIWGPFWTSLLMSYIVGIIATIINLVVGFPMAVTIARRKFGGRITAILDALISIPITVPSVALGVSLSYFWAAFGNIPEFWVLVLVHTTITYTYFVRATASAIEGVPGELEEVARTLGGSPFKIFRKIIIPLTKYSIFSGAIMVLTRSIDETGATVAVVKTIKTAPVLLVDWINQGYPASTVGLGILFLVITAFASLIVLRLTIRRN